LPIALIDQEGKVLASSKWQRLCIDFHRAHPQTLAGCVMSDTVLAQRLQKGENYAVYQCANGLVDCATPIVVDGVHVANLFTGQFLRDAPDLDGFRRQQMACGFDPEAYFEALADIPVVAEERIPAILKLLKGLAQQIARQSLAEQRALSTLAVVEKQVEARTREVREGEQRFRALFEGSPVGQVIFDPDSLLILECNRVAAEIYGRSCDELRQLRVGDLDAAHDAAALQAMRREVDAKGQLRFETRICRKDGELRDLIVNIATLPSAQGSRFHATYIDITEHKQAEQARAKISRALRLLTDCNAALLHADDEQKLLDEICRLTVDTGGYLMAWAGFAAHDADKSVRPVAQSGCEAGYLESIRVSWDDSEFGRSPTGLAIRTGVTQINQNCQTAPHLAPWREAAVKRGYQASIALPLVGDGLRGALTIHAREAEAFVPEEVRLLEKLADNLVFGIEGLRARLRLAGANRQLQDFTYAASHDMRGPLGRIAAFSALLERKCRDRLGDEGLQFLGFIRENATRLNTLVEDLLTHSQVERQSSGLQPVDLRATVLAVLEEQREEIAQCGAKLRIDLPAARAQGHPHSLMQALRNLVANALKYSARAQPPIVEITGELRADRYHLRIRDNGIGFDMAYHDRIFEIFRRLHTYAEYPGNGVGLALVKKAIESMGGKVWAESTPGQGATFFLELQAAN
jgi:PAS domain S-box-containing protein